MCNRRAWGVLGVLLQQSPWAAPGQCVLGIFTQRALEWGRFQVFCSILSAADFPTLWFSRGLFLQRLDGSIKGEIRKQALDHFNADGSEVQRAWLCYLGSLGSVSRGKAFLAECTVSETVHSAAVLPDKRNHWRKRCLLTWLFVTPEKHMHACFSSLGWINGRVALISTECSLVLPDGKFLDLEEKQGQVAEGWPIGLTLTRVLLQKVSPVLLVTWVLKSMFVVSQICWTLVGMWLNSPAWTDSSIGSSVRCSAWIWQYKVFCF